MLWHCVTVLQVFYFATMDVDQLELDKITESAGSLWSKDTTLPHNLRSLLRFFH